jgi:choline dehydrogenase
MASVFNPINPLTEAFINAGIELGWPRNDDNNGASQEGFGPFQYTIYQGKRESTAVSYLHSVENRPNLTIQIRALATRILFEGSRAVGVAYLKDGVEQQARANKEVILSGGCVNSPQLLMLSGIGPADHLREMGIQVITDLPGVGRNLHDHPYVGVYFTTKPSFAELSSHITTGLATAFIKTQPELPKPDIQLIFLPCFFPPETGSGYSFLVILTTPQSRGRLTLRSADPTQYPIIHANYLGNIEDLQALIAGIRLAQPVGRAKAYAPFYAADAFPGPQVQSDQAMSEYIRNGLSTMNHPVGTCKMGHDEMAVVDEQLRVRGLEGLRVVDASIMPTISDGNINAAVIMIAEKGADMCKSQH